MFGCPGAKAVEKVAFGIEVADGVAKDGALAHHVATQGGKGKQADAQEGCHKHNAQVALALGGKDNLRRKEGEKGCGDKGFAIASCSHAQGGDHELLLGGLFCAGQQSVSAQGERTQMLGLRNMAALHMR